MDNIIRIKKSHIIDKIEGNKVYPSKEFMKKFVEFWWAKKLYGISYFLIEDG